VQFAAPRVNAGPAELVSVFQPVLRKCLGRSARFRCLVRAVLHKCRGRPRFFAKAPIVGLGELKTDCHRKSRW
jgi:hypothetical protein